MTGRSPSIPSTWDGVLMTVVAAGVAVGSWVWCTAELAGWSAAGHWPQVSLAELAAALGRLPRHLGDPRRAWPPYRQGELPGPGWFYVWATINGLAAGAGVFVFGRRRGRGRRRRGGGRWAVRSDLRSVTTCRSGRPGRLVLGRTGPTGRLVATEARHSVLVLGPTQSGKTSGLAIPAILEWEGPVVAASVKADLASHSLGWRSARGPCWVFDPTGASGLSPLAGWSPLSAASSWSDAQRVASWLVEATPGRRGLADAAFWYSTAAKQLAPLLLAAERGGLAMADVVRWTDAEEFGEPLRLLETAGEEPAAGALEACAGREERIRSSVGTTLETVLAPFADPVVAASTARTDVAVGDLIAGPGTLFLCGPTQEQSRVQ
ncbi:MAG: type IV secretory system conjugative DNA transfer family protein, partial [Acidimicrobiales bacterium]|nr:type IV secretory system conjugative DNA transfer family protein [Acidimicrobiales bacterium]